MGEATVLDDVFEGVVAGARVPSCTYRVQLNAGFGFCDAAALVPYLDALGVSDLYASPFFKARAGSAHGYDLVDHNALSPELGSRAELDALSAELRARGMGLLLDFVPNHMGVAGEGNAWWADLLENGPGSPYAPFFDVDWAPLKPELAGKVLLPILGHGYGRSLEDGELRLGFDHGAFSVRYYDHVLPIDPRTSTRILAPMLPALIAELGDEHDATVELRSILTGLGHLPPREETRRAEVIERRREREVLKRRLAALAAAEPRVAAALDARVRAMNGAPGDPASFDELHELLEAQAYRVGSYRVAAEQVNYRRFFDVNDLAALRMENPAVFAEAHRLLFQLLADGVVTGLRIDHPDGLWDPVAYFARVQRAVFLERCRRALAHLAPDEQSLAEAALTRRFEAESAAHPEAPLRPLYIVAEKILTRGEELPRSFAVHGTSGYDFGAISGALFVDAAAELEMTAIYEHFLGRATDFASLVHDKKMVILRASLASELNVLAQALSRLSERDRHTRDFTLGALGDALREVIACFPVYRTYVREDTTAPEPRDRAAINVAVRLARRRSPTLDASVYDFVRSILLLEVPPTAPEDSRPRFRELVMRLQELTGPVMAKGIEDTAFYVYNRLLALNEVGGEPDRFGAGVAELHQASEERRRAWPGSLLATSTHDTKRSEDVRARIRVLSEVPGEWAATLGRLARATAPFERDLDGQRAPDHNEQYLFFQTILGTWPAPGPGPEYVERIVAYLRKATKEAKVNTSWIDAAPDYDAAVEAYVRGALGSPAFADAIAPLAATLAYHGRFGALAEVLLKLTSPGVPDLYQGTEIWDDSLVDPDNRRPVDFARRAAVLAELRARRDEGATLARELVETAADGRIKLFVTHVALDARRRSPEAFGPAGAYTPLVATGARREHVIAFARRGPDGAELLSVAPRLTARLAGGRHVPPLGEVWGDTALLLPRAGRYQDLFTGRTVAADPAAPLGGLLADFPLALLRRCTP